MFRNTKQLDVTTVKKSAQEIHLIFHVKSQQSPCFIFIFIFYKRICACLSLKIKLKLREHLKLFAQSMNDKP